jgi:hypothetical protein
MYLVEAGVGEELHSGENELVAAIARSRDLEVLQTADVSDVVLRVVLKAV